MTYAAGPDDDNDRLQLLAAEVKALVKRRHNYPYAGSEVRRFLGRLPELCELAGTPDADPRRTLRAVDSLVLAAATELGRRDASAGDSEKVLPVACLLGFESGTASRRPWGDRQKAAATAAGQSVETFRREPQERLFYQIASELLRDSTRADDGERAGTTGELTVFPGQEEVRGWLIKYIRRKAPQEARFILSSGVASTEVFLALRDMGAAITILLCHPRSAVTKAQQSRGENFVEDIRNVHLRRYEQLRIYLYKAPPTLRGWHIGDRVGLSWYTYRGSRAGDVGRIEQLDLGGHDNLVIVGDTQSSPGEQLGGWFDREAASLLESRFTISEAEYYEEQHASAMAEAAKRRRGSVTVPTGDASRGFVG